MAALSDRSDSMRPVRGVLWVAGLVIGVAAGVSLSESGVGPFSSPAALVFAILLGWSFIASGLVAWARRPDNRTGPLLAAVGFLWLASGGLVSTTEPVAVGIGLIFSWLYIVVFAHLLLAFPTGRLESRLSRIVIGLGYFDVTVIPLLWVLSEQRPNCDGCTAPGLAVWPSETAADAFLLFGQSFGAVLSVIALGIIVHRYRSATPPWRRAFAPVLWAGSAAFAALIVLLVNEAVGEPFGLWLEWLYWAVFALVPVAFLVGLLRTRFARSAIAPLVTDLGRAKEPREVRAALARAVRDPSLVVGYWLPEEQRYVDADGDALELADSDGRMTRAVVHDDRRIAGLELDASLHDDPELVDAVCAAAALALENQQLQAELRANIGALRRERDFIRAVVETAPTLVCILTPDAKLTFFNAACEQVSGYGADEVLGRDLCDVLVPPDEHERLRGSLASAGSAGGAIENENHWITKSGERRLIAWLNTTIPGDDDASTHIVGAGLDITVRKRQEEELRGLQAELEARLDELTDSRNRVVQAATHERQKIERNLHDGAQQRLVALSLTLRLAQNALGSDPEQATQLLDEAAGELGLAIDELRELARGIHPAVLSERGLEPALEALCLRSPMPIDLSVDLDRGLPPTIEIAAYYTVSEALANIAKYANASHVTVTVAQQNGAATVEIVDDGVGGADPGAGTGLRGLADRVEALDGSLEIDSPQGSGTTVRARIPVGSASAEAATR